MKSRLPQQLFPSAKPLDYRKPVRCHAEELDRLLEAGRTAGFGMTEIKTVKGQFCVTFRPVAAYQTTNQPCV